MNENNTLTKIQYNISSLSAVIDIVNEESTKEEKLNKIRELTLTYRDMISPEFEQVLLTVQCLIAFGVAPAILLDYLVTSENEMVEVKNKMESIYHNMCEQS